MQWLWKRKRTVDIGDVRVSAVRLGPRDTVVVTCTRQVSAECRAAIKHEVGKLLGGCNSVIVLDGGMTIDVLKQGELRGRVMTAEEREHLKREWHAQYGKGVTGGT